MRLQSGLTNEEGEENTAVYEDSGSFKGMTGKDGGIQELWSGLVETYDGVSFERKTSTRQIQAHVRQWLDEIVIGLNLCPFAERAVHGFVPGGETEKDNTSSLYETIHPPSSSNQSSNNGLGESGRPLLTIPVIRGKNETLILQWMGVELLRRAEQSGTTLVVCPDCHVDHFEEFMEVVHRADALIEELDLEGQVQIAPFHPLFRFHGSSPETTKVDDWTNRSPYPMFHILREDEVETAVERLQGDAGRVWKRNVNLLHAIHEALGTSGLERLFNVSSFSPNTTATLSNEPHQLVDRMTATERTTVQSLLRKHRLSMGSAASSKKMDNQEAFD